MNVGFRIEFRRHDLLDLTQRIVVDAVADERVFSPPYSDRCTIDAK